MANSLRRWADERGGIPAATRARLLETSNQLHHIAELAVLALTGNEPQDGIDYLVEALELLRADLRSLHARGTRRAA
jgi:poly(A) polymerase Pap1